MLAVSIVMMQPFKQLRIIFNKLPGFAYPGISIENQLLKIMHIFFHVEQNFVKQISFVKIICFFIFEKYRKLWCFGR